ncbi:Fic family protein [Candidatus Roizmanbacteria bacterium]|nr:Fic family protein [Candidatus Roizmanbacteria bacterium]
MFSPRFTYTNKLVSNIGTIRESIGTLRERRFPTPVFVQLEKDARALSAFSSTRIEGNPLPLTDVKKILKSRPEHIKNSEREVLNYNNALVHLNEIIQSKKPLSLTNEFICRIQKMVTDGLLVEFSNGVYRRQPVFVNDPLLQKTVYWPPDHTDVLPFMNDLIAYINTQETQIDYLILAGIFHQQFVIIHPFLDGNGRTTRLITKALLAKMGLDTFQLFSFENYYNANITKYFQKVGMKGNYYDVYKTWDFTGWLEYFTDGILDELQRVTALLPQATSLEDRLEPHHNAILDLLRDKGVIKDSDYAQVTNRSRASRILDFQKLGKLGMIQRNGKGRGTYYVLR